MTQHIVRFHKGFTYSGNYPVIWSVLTCGHGAKTTMKPRRGECCDCRAEFDLRDDGKTVCTCGSRAFYVRWRPSEHVDDDRLSRIGDAVECAQCDQQAASEAWLLALDPAAVSHSRFRYGSYHFYGRDSASPSGVRLLGSVTPSDNVEKIMKLRGYSPLSPTEGLQVRNG